MTTYGGDFYSLPQVDNILINYVFVHMEHMENRHLTPLLSKSPLYVPNMWFDVRNIYIFIIILYDVANTRYLPELFIKPFVGGCPQGLWQLLSSLLPILLTFIGSRLTQGWNAVLTRGQEAR